MSARLPVRRLCLLGAVLLVASTTSLLGARPAAASTRSPSPLLSLVLCLPLLCDRPPAAVLTVTPSSGSAPLAVTADGSGSTDKDLTPIRSYRFDFGDGTVVGPQRGSSATHTYSTAGTFSVRLIVADTAGHTGSAARTVNVTPPAPATLYVDRGNASCSDAGAGSAAAPFCTIGAGAKAAQPGYTVSVAPGTYPEQVAPHSGTAGLPITFAAQGSGTVVQGDSSRNYGFNIAAVHDVVVTGFELAQQNITGAKVDAGSANIELRNLLVHDAVSYGIRVEGSSAVIVAGNMVSRAGSHGILVKDSTNVSVLSNVSHDNAFHGIALLGTSDSRVTGNTAYGNITPNNRRANGIDIDASAAGGSSNNVIEDNRTYLNDDSGIQVVNGSDNNVVRRNLSWTNGDHGFDTLTATGTRFVSNTAFGNAIDGFSVEGNSTNTTLADNIGTGNGVAGNPDGRGHWDLYVDTSSSSGFSSDNDLIWSSTEPMPIFVNGATYPSLTAFRTATGNETHGVDGDPKFVSTSTPDLHLAAGSPAIDAANAGAPGFTAPDIDGSAPFDDPATANTGAGTPPYADLGALEYRS